MLKTYEVRPSPVPSRRWWQTARLNEFDDHLQRLSVEELNELLIDLKVAIRQCQDRTENKTLSKEDRRRATSAVRYYASKRDLTTREIGRRHP
jgi:hypothetical protein